MIKPIMSEKEVEELFNEVEQEITQTGSELDEQQPQTDSEVDENHHPTEEELKKILKNRGHNCIDTNNPYRTESKVDLSKEKNEFRWIETNVLNTMMKSRLNGSEWSVFFYILHRTRGYCNKQGFYKSTEDITVEEIQEYTDLSIPTIYKTLKSLMTRKMVYEVKKGHSYKIGINFRYDTWKINESVSNSTGLSVTQD